MLLQQRSAAACSSSAASSSQYHCAPVLRPSRTQNLRICGIEPAGRQQQQPASLINVGVNRATLSPSAHKASSLLCRAAASASGVEDDYRLRDPKDVRVAVFGCTGYIGKFVTKELAKRGYNVVAFTREQAGIKGKMGKEEIKKEFEGVDVRFGNVMDVESLRSVAFKDKVDVVVSCLASRTGGKKDSQMIDYQATKNCLDVARECGSSHFVLLSAICVQKPELEFQRAKLKLENELRAATDITHSIVRPTAFFKSVAGQIQLVKDGAPFVMFGDGTLAACKPISEANLASFIADCVAQKDKVNQILPIGGPGKAYTAREQAEILFRLTGKPQNFFPVPVALMDGIINLLDFLAKFFPEKLEDAAEFGRIGRYYAVESMLVWDPVKQQYLPDETPSYGDETLEAFFATAVKEGLKGQELGDQAVFGVNEE